MASLSDAEKELRDALAERVVAERGVDKAKDDLNAAIHRVWKANNTVAVLKGRAK